MRPDYGYIALLRVLICFGGIFLDTNLHWGILGICCSGVLPDILGLDDMLCNDKRRIHGYCSGGIEVRTQGHTSRSNGLIDCIQVLRC